MTLEEIESYLMSATTNQRTGEMYQNVYIRIEPIESRTAFVKEALNQIKRVVNLCAMGVLDPKEHRAEALLLMILDQSIYHGFTPKEKVS